MSSGINHEFVEHPTFRAPRSTAVAEGGPPAGSVLLIPPEEFVGPFETFRRNITAKIELLTEVLDRLRQCAAGIEPAVAEDLRSHIDLIHRTMRACVELQRTSGYYGGVPWGDAMLVEERPDRIFWLRLSSGSWWRSLLADDTTLRGRSLTADSANDRLLAGSSVEAWIERGTNQSTHAERVKVHANGAALRRWLLDEAMPLLRQEIGRVEAMVEAKRGYLTRQAERWARVAFGAHVGAHRFSREKVEEELHAVALLLSPGVMKLDEADRRIARLEGEPLDAEQRKLLTTLFSEWVVRDGDARAIRLRDEPDKTDP